MGLSLQSVRWALEFPCPYRQRHDWQDPEVAVEELFELRVLNDSQIFEGFCITDLIGVPDETGAIQGVPIHGFELTGPLLEHGTSICKSCPCNIGPEGVAGCQGWLNIDARSDKLHDWVEEQVEVLGIDDELRSLFPSTEPRWYGLWIDSPLSTPQRDVLLKLFETSRDEEFAHFHRALSSQFPLHVSLCPPSDAGLGWSTTFGHCDNCKAIPDLTVNSNSVQLCRVCGHSFRSRDHQRMERMIAPISLMKLVGEKEHEDFIRRWHQLQGLSEAQIRSVYENFRNRIFRILPN